MPTLFLSHGAPSLAISEASTSNFLRNLAAEVPAPMSILVVSAHWETDIPAVSGAERPEMIYDFHGFPQELYQLKYNPAGNPLLAQRIKKILHKKGFPAEIDIVRGLDHGAWSPLLLSYPKTEVPVTQLSVQPKKNAAWHYQIGQCLKELRQDNVLIIGSGNLTHNLREAMHGNHNETPEWVTAFSSWVAEKLQSSDIESLLNWQEVAPYALKNHPTPEHFLPFFVALGATNIPIEAKRMNQEIEYGVLAMDAYIFS